MSSNNIAKLCFSLTSRAENTTLEILPVMNAFLQVCKKAKAALKVEADRRKYITILELSVPKNDEIRCRDLAEALIAAELGNNVKYSRVKCQQNFWES